MRILKLAGMSVVLSIWPMIGQAELPFEVVPVSAKSVPLERVLDGSVEAVNQATISAQTSGRIVKINYDVDDYVKKGDVILRINNTEQTAGAEQAKAGLAEAQSLYVQARDEKKRIADIYTKKLVSKRAFDKANADAKAALARLNAAKAKLAQAKEQLDYSIVRAPYSGIVSERHVEVGEMTSPGKPLMTGTSLDHLRVTVRVPQREIAKIRSHRSAAVVLDDGTRLASEKLTFFPFADAKTNTFKVRVSLNGNAKGLFPGMFAKVAFAVGEQQNVFVPAAAVVYRSELTALYVVDAQERVSLRQVRLGRRMGDQVVVLSGLKDGEKVALDGVAAGVYLKSLHVAKGAE